MSSSDLSFHFLLPWFKIWDCSFSFLAVFFFPLCQSRIFSPPSMDHRSYADFTTNFANPFYLYPNESSTLILVAPPLDNKNYQTWSCSMLLALISKNKEKFVDGSFPKPFVTGPLFSQWIWCNTMVVSWIQRSISDSIVKSVL